MSLTSYRAAPSRDRVVWYVSFREIRVVFARFGGDLLSHVLRRSTIAAAALNFRVRDGTGCFARAMATRPRKKPVAVRRVCLGKGDGREAASFAFQKARSRTVAI